MRVVWIWFSFTIHKLLDWFYIGKDFLDWFRYFIWMVVNGGWLYGWLNGFQRWIVCWKNWMDGLIKHWWIGWIKTNNFFCFRNKIPFFLQTISIISFWIITVNIPVDEQNSFFLANNLDDFFLGNQHWWVVLIFGNKCNKIWFLVDGWWLISSFVLGKPLTTKLGSDGSQREKSLSLTYHRMKIVF